MGKKRHPANSKLIAENKRSNKVIFPAQSVSLCIFLMRYNARKMLKNSFHYEHLSRLFSAPYFTAKDTQQKR